MIDGMSGNVEPISRRSGEKAERVQKIIEALQPRYTDPPVIHVRAMTDPITGEVFSMMNPKPISRREMQEWGDGQAPQPIVEDLTDAQSFQDTQVTTKGFPDAPAASMYFES